MTNNFEYRSGAIDASVCLSEGWNLVKNNYGVFLGMAVLEIVIVMLVGLIRISAALSTPLSPAY